MMDTANYGTSTAISTGTNPVIIIAPIISISFFLTLILLIRHRNRAMKKYMKAYNLSMKAPETMDQWERQVGAEVEERAVQEADIAAGNQVWFSRYMCTGVVKHWSFVVNYTKFELRCDQPDGNYSYNSGPYTQAEEEERANLAEVIVPESDGYITCLIGWTPMSQKQVWSVFEQCQKEYGLEVLPSGKCGMFMQAFASKVVTKSAIDRRWLGDNAQAFFSPTQRMPRPPPALISARMQSQQKMRFRQPPLDDQTTAVLVSNLAVNRQLLNASMPSTVFDDESPPSYYSANYRTSPSHLSHHHSAHMLHSSHHDHHAMHVATAHSHHNSATHSSSDTSNGGCSGIASS